MKHLNKYYSETDVKQEWYSSSNQSVPVLQNSSNAVTGQPFSKKQEAVFSNTHLFGYTVHKRSSKEATWRRKFQKTEGQLQ